MRYALSIIFLIAFFSLLTGTVKAQDWANLSRFRMENQALNAPSEQEKRVVFMGNSITEGWPDHAASFFQNSAYINRGISGQTTPQMLLRFRQDVIALSPSAVVILAGINDIAGNTGPATVDMIMDNIISMAELARVNDIPVILCSVLPAAAFPWAPTIEPVTEVLALNEKIKAYCLANGLVYVDYFTAMADADNGLQASLTYDGVHPNQTGYLVMGPLVEAAIRKTLD